MLEHALPVRIVDREGRGRILCVDDEPNMLILLSIGLGRRFEIVTADGGAQGLLMLVERGPFDVVVSDLKMPGMNGSEFLRQVAMIAPATARIILTGDIGPAAAEARNDIGLFRFLKKPCALPEISLALDEAIAHSRAAGLRLGNAAP